MQTVHLTQEQTIRQTQTQRIAPSQIQANLLLQCSTQELLQAIEQEQQENPALESVDRTDDISCPNCSIFGMCPQCAEQGARAERESDRYESMDADMSGDDATGTESSEERLAIRTEWDNLRAEGGSSSPSGDSDFDPLLLVRAPSNLADQLLMHLTATSADAREAKIAEYLVFCLDDHGYLQLDIEEACAVLRVPCSLISTGVQRLQACDPPGIGARDLRECLLLQVIARREQGDADGYDPIAEILLRDHWLVLSSRKHTSLARRLGVSRARIAEAISYIQAKLTPYPAAMYRQSWDNCPNTQSMAIRPDVSIRRSISGFTIELIGLENVDLQVNSHYQQLYQTLRQERSLPGGEKRRITDYDRHVVTHVEKAEAFIKNLHQRRRTIQRITQHIVEQQQGYIETGKRRFLRPMTRTKVAQELGLHESTVSRALLHKYVQLPSQETVSFDIFFENAVSAKDAMADLVAKEDPGAPLTDYALQAKLCERGFDIARRTVVKYREDLRIPSSFLRRYHN